MKVIYVIQARTNSTRLPAKVLLPIGNIPIVVLAAKRAANLGIETIVLTSQEKTDDYLCEVLNEFNVPYFRGSLDNTLDRFVSALNEYEDNTVVVRLTADNIVPDGKFIAQVVEDFLLTESKYLSTSGEASGLPYGLSAEVMYLCSLRDANRNTKELFDCEHVTPYIRKKYGVQVFEKLKYLDMADKRCTIDVLDDYLAMAKIFIDIDDAVNEPAENIIKRIDEKSCG
ncbi:MAG: spore coat polysaccharide biosynthesis protein SpsF (cytidylyltransferase family) [Oleiphilaceae bacterium]|jgi:spore coat polysaccharide biosynthesis protein SpsF (cytidylyltransferase family)